MAKSPPANSGDVRDAGSIPGLGRSPGAGNGNFTFFHLYLFYFGCFGSSLLPAGLSLVVASGGYFLVAVFRLLIVVASLVTEHQL